MGAATAAALAIGSVAGLAQAAPPPVPVLVWSVASPSQSPVPLAYSSAAYDADNSTIVLFGGTTANGTMNDTTWVWNGRNWNDPDTPEPPARDGASMAFDPALHQLVLFGGQAPGGALLADTWAWNGASWVQIAQSGASPSPREASAMAYDGHGQLVLFGGTGYNAGSAPPTTVPGGIVNGPASQTSAAGLTTATGQTTTAGLTTATGQTTTAVQSQGGATPSRRPSGSQEVAAADTGAQEVTASGSDPTSLVTLSDTWVWTSSGWAQSTATGPPARSGAAISTDEVNGTTVLFGGESTPAASTPAGLLGDTWVWDGATWTRAKPGASPSARVGATADYAPHPSTVRC